MLTMDGGKAVEAMFERHGAVRWTKTINHPGSDFFTSTATDRDGNFLVGGLVQLGESIPPDLYVAKLAGDTGAVVWERLFSSPSGESLRDLAVDGTGNVYLVGNVGNGSIDLDGHVVTADLFGDILVARLAASDGRAEWAVGFGGDGVDVGGGIAVSDGGEVFIAGEFTGTATNFGSFTLVAAGTDDMFVARLRASDGLVLSARAFTGTTRVDDVATSGSDVLVTGRMRQTMDLDGITLSPSTGASFDGLLIGLIGSSLSVRWATRFGDATGDDSAVGADGYPGGGFVITGYFRGSAYFGGQTFTSAGDTDAFILRVMPSGAHVWSDSFGGVTGDVGGGIATDLLGNFVLTGYFASSIDLGGPPLVGTNDVFVGRFGSGALPSHEWSVALGGADTEIGNDIALDAAGSVCVVGNFNGITDLGGTELTSMGTDGIAIGLVR